MHIGDVACRGAARIDGNDLGAALLARGDKPLIKHRMAPGRVAADQYDQIGVLDILVAARHDILAERADMAGHRRRHAEPRIGVDIAAADETLHQLVGDVIILGQELAGDVERDRVRPVLGDGPAEARGDAVERFVPARIAAADLRIEQPSVAARACRRARRPWSTAGRNWPDGPDLRTARRRRRAYAAADAAIGTGGADHAACHCSPARFAPALAPLAASRAFIACSA